MKTSMYFNYTSRSLLRGGQRTVLAIFCVAVGVMAIVALQLAGSMLQNSLTSNTRDTNGGDIAVTSTGVPLKSSDLSVFAQLESKGTITNYTAVTTASGTLSATGSTLSSFTVEAVDPNNFPVVSEPTFVTPGNGNIANLLTNGRVIVTQNFLDTYHKHVGDSLNVYTKSLAGSGETLHVTIDGVVANSGVFAQSSNLVLVSQHDYTAAAPNVPAAYNEVYVTTVDQAHTDAAVKAINSQLPLVSTQTVADALKAQQTSINNINEFLEIAGLLALLIGGVGIVNTMQVLLSRRKTEIAMLKTAGYRKVDLYLLFGLEAGMLGLIGGVVGAAAATGVSYIVRSLMQNLGLAIPFILNPWTVAGGVAIGFLTALIFGLMPIVQAANIRPLNVIRELPENKGASSVMLTIGLLVILSVLFCGLAIVILNNNVMLGIGAVYGTFAFLLVLSAFFGLVVFIVSKLPVPERFNLKSLALILAGVVASALVYLLLPVFGILMFAASLMGIAVILMPRSWKVSTKMALRNIGRQRTRTTTTMVALFIGVFTVGLVLALGQDLQVQISNAFTQNLTYNVVTLTSGTDTATLQSKINTVPGLSKTRTDTYTQIVPVAINGQPLQQILGYTGHDRQEVVSFLSSMEGYNLARNVPSLTIVQGRNLNASDAGTNNIVISDLLTSSGPFGMHLKPGDTITFASADGKTTTTATVVGVYGRTSAGSQVGSVQVANSTVQHLSSAGAGITTITYMKIDPAQVNKALNTLGTIVPNATVQNLADLGTYITQMLNNILEMLVAIASLSLIAGIIIVANAVALAMLERRRELGILKSVGYTSSSVLSEVMIENGIVGSIGAFMAMLLATGAIALLGSFLFNLKLSTTPWIIVSLIAGAAVLAMGTAALVAWGSVRVRPLEVLRYE
ncbi:MAG TPA: FtsX-like permease family protein [Ktedonobacteraceae bacterium]|nr:FtsX-like permease family protein [Ktedonobacteraceae bacterium]